MWQAGGGGPRGIGGDLSPGQRSMCNPALRWDRADPHVAQEDDESHVNLDMARQMCRQAPRGEP